jgi:diguanylate cyclase (GGDEF)-like protein
MLSVPTLWTVFITNFLALGLIWAYVMRCYPSFDAARFWTASSFTAAAGAALAMLRVMTDSLPPLLGAGTAMILALCLAAMGIQRFFDRPVAWRGTWLITGLSLAGLSFFMFGYDSASARISIFTIAQTLPLALGVKLLLTPHQGRVNPGARLAAIVAILIIAIYGVRLVAGLMNFGGEFTYMKFTQVQSAVILVLVFLSMALNFGLLLMAMDRLRNEVADLALLDDLTGVGNRRHLLQRLTEECARSERSGQPFALLVIDLDGFKAINDTHGHAAGDAVLRHLATRIATVFRPLDVVARMGGEEFAVLLPSTGLDDALAAAERVRRAVEAEPVVVDGVPIPVTLSGGVSAMNPDTADIAALMKRADQALYAAKDAGRNRIQVSAG